MDLQFLIAALGRPAGDLLATVPFEEVPFDEQEEERALCFVAPENGVQFATTEDHIVDTIWISSGHDDPGFKPFNGALIGGINFNSTRKDVRTELGEPSANGEATGILTPRPAIAWDRYDYANYSLHFEYFKAGMRLRRVTVMSPSRVPR